MVKAFSVPLAFAAGVHTSDSAVPSSVVPADTANPSLVNDPVLTASTRKPTTAPSASASSAAVANVA